MSIKWSDIHIGNELLTKRIFMGKSKPMKDNPKVSIWTDKSDDISNECMYAVCCMLKQELEENGELYAGYEYEDGSKLIYIPSNRKFNIEEE